MLRVDLGTPLQRRHRRFVLPDPLQRDAPVKVRFGQIGVECECVLEVRQRLLGFPERIERYTSVEQRFGVRRVELERSVVALQRFFVAIEMVQQDALPHQRVRRARMLAHVALDHSQRVRQASHFEVVRRDLLQVVRVEERRRPFGERLLVRGHAVSEPVTAKVVVVLEIEHRRWGERLSRRVASGSV